MSRVPAAKRTLRALRALRFPASQHHPADVPRTAELLTTRLGDRA